MPVMIEIAYRRSGHVGPELMRAPRLLKGFVADYPIRRLERSKGRVVVLFESGIELRLEAVKEKRE